MSVERLRDVATTILTVATGVFAAIHITLGNTASATLDVAILILLNQGRRR